MLRRVPAPVLHHTSLCMRTEALSVTVTDTECIHEFDLTFEDPCDAEDAFAGRDGYNFDGNRLRVEPADGGRGSGGPSHDCSSSFGGGGGGGRGHRGVSKHSDYRVLVTGLPSSATSQYLKEHMRRAGDVCFSEVYHVGSGKLDFKADVMPVITLRKQ